MGHDVLRYIGGISNQFEDEDKNQCINVHAQYKSMYQCIYIIQINASMCIMIQMDASMYIHDTNQCINVHA